MVGAPVRALPAELVSGLVRHVPVGHQAPLLLCPHFHTSSGRSVVLPFKPEGSSFLS